MSSKEWGWMLFFPYGEFNLTLFPLTPIQAASFGAPWVRREINPKSFPLPRCVQVHFAPCATPGFPQGLKAQVCLRGLQKWCWRGPTPPGSAARPLHGCTEQSCPGRGAGSQLLAQLMHLHHCQRDGSCPPPWSSGRAKSVTFTRDHR